jgi:hypothetical protein
MSGSYLSGPPAPERERRRASSVRIFYGAAIALALSLFLPWVSVLGLVSVHLSGFEVVYLLAFAAVYAGAAYLVQHDRVTSTFMIAAWVVNAWMIVNVFVIFDEFGKGGGLVTPGAGVYVASIGVLAAIVATFQLHRSRKHAGAGTHDAAAVPVRHER